MEIHRDSTTDASFLNQNPTLQSSFSDSHKKLMNRYELKEVIIQKFIKDYPCVNELKIEQTVADYIKNLNKKLSHLHLKELKDIIHLISLEKYNSKEHNISSSNFIDSKKSNSLSPFRDLSAHSPQNSKNSSLQVKKISYPAVSPQSPKQSSQSPKQSSQSLKQSSQSLKQSPQSPRQYSPPSSSENTAIFFGKTIKFLPNCNRQQYIVCQEYDKIQLSDKISHRGIPFVKVKSILKVNKSLSPHQQRTQLLFEKHPPFSVLSTFPRNIPEKISIDCVSTTSLSKYNQFLDRFNQSKTSLKEEEISGHMSQRQLDNTIKDLQISNHNIITGCSIDPKTPPSFDILKYQQQASYKNGSEWKRKLESIRNLRTTNLSEEEEEEEEDRKKQEIRQNQQSYEQQQIDMNYAEQVKKNAINLNIQMQLERLKKVELQMKLKEYYDGQMSVKKSEKQTSLERDKNNYSIKESQNHEEMIEKHSAMVNKVIRDARKEELQMIEQTRIKQRKTVFEENKCMRVKYEREEETEQERERQKKIKEYLFYQGTAATQFQKHQDKIAQNYYDKMYMLNYTSLLDKQQDLRVSNSLQRKKDLQIFIKKQTENYPKMREKLMRIEEKEVMKAKILNDNEQEVRDKQYKIALKKDIQHQMRDFLTFQIQEKNKLINQAHQTIQRSQNSGFNVKQIQQEQDNQIAYSSQMEQNVIKDQVCSLANPHILNARSLNTLPILSS